jgi:hypothetical protein
MISVSFLFHTGCFKIREFRIQSVVGKDPVELEKYLEKKFALPDEHISTLILFNTGWGIVYAHARNRHF